MLLKDIAYFLHQRVKVFCHDDIYNYKINDCDVAYPEKVFIDNQSMINSSEMWFLPVKRTCFLFSNIKPCFNVVFL